ncbi:MAG: xylose isomerase-like barrel family protein, partial [Alphaproteobacteria bacterium]|nr:xylose isomerase-like barrel family protein [Alphaproteobacteria bacterium]
PSVSRADVPAVAGALDANGVRLCNLEVFPLDRDGGLERFREGLEIGAALGAGRATAHIHDADADQAVARFAAFAAYAAGFGIVAGLEFNAFSAITDLAAAASIVRKAGVGSLVLDTLHLVRSGGGAADVAAVADLADYCQLSDGPRRIEQDQRWREAVAERMIPGEGEFGIADLLRPLRGGTIIEIEVPQKAAMIAGVSAEQRAGRAVAGGRRMLQEAFG